MANFTVSDFSRMIPEFKGDSQSLLIFLKRCDTFHNSLSADGKKSFLSYLVFKLRDNAMTIYESKAYVTWDALRKDLLDGIKVSKSHDALLTELMSMTQGSDESAKEFSDSIREKLKELNDLIKAQNTNPDVVTSMKSNFEKTSIRTFREGLKPPLKYRVMNFEATTLDEITKKAVEEEPFVKVAKSSLENKGVLVSDTPKENDYVRFSKPWYRNNNFPRKNQYPFRPNRFGPQRHFSRQSWTDNPSVEKTLASMNISTNDRDNHHDNLRNGDQQRNGNSRTFNSPFNNFARNTFQQSDRVCLRCNRRGHTLESCFANLNKPNVQGHSTAQSGEKKVSFFDQSRNHHTIPGTTKTYWSKDQQK